MASFPCPWCGGLIALGDATERPAGALLAVCDTCEAMVELDATGQVHTVSGPHRFRALRLPGPRPIDAT